MMLIKSKTYKLTFPSDVEIIALFEKEETFPSTGGPSSYWFSRQSGDNSLCGHFPKGFVPENWFHIPTFLMNQLKIEEVSDDIVIENVESVTENDIKACGEGILTYGEGILAWIIKKRKDLNINVEKLDDLERLTREVMVELKGEKD